MQTFRMLAIFVVLGIVGFIVARQWPVMFPDATVVQVDPACDLAAAACTTTLPDGGEVTLSITPRPIPLMETLQVSTQTRNTPWRVVQLDITGLNMEMGLNRTKLVAQQKNSTLGETVLPVCSQRRMHWQAELLMQNGDKKYRLAHQFFTVRP